MPDEQPDTMYHLTLLEDNRNLVEFINVRSKLACKSSEMAKRMLTPKKVVEDNKTINVADEIKKFMKTKCPKVLKEVEGKKGKQR
ncbi:MAG: hypothetical protein HQK92_00720 [Nitrospirae bacterium]|nr:hypothetical protein [Nitrospirota bacterium]